MRASDVKEKRDLTCLWLPSEFISEETQETSSKAKLHVQRHC